MGVRFPEYDWTLSWNADGIDLSDATIGVVGLIPFKIDPQLYIPNPDNLDI